MSFPNIILVDWILFYLLPATIAFSVAFHQKTRKARLLVIHIGLAISILFLLFTGARLRMSVHLIPLICFVLAIALAVYFLARLWVVYILSSILQELCLLLAAVLLIQQAGLIYVAIPTAFVYSFGHLMDKRDWGLKLSVTTVWGISSILLYYYFQQPLLNIALHITGGAILINRGYLYKQLP